MKIEQLNDKYFKLYSELYKALPYLPDKQSKAMHTALFHQYQNELEFTVSEWQLEHGIDLFELRFKVATQTPRKFLFWWNPIGRRLLKRYKANFKTMLDNIFLPSKMDQSPSTPSQDVTTALTTTSTEVHLQPTDEPSTVPKQT